MYKAVRLFNYKDGIGLEQDALRGVCEVEEHVCTTEDEIISACQDADAVMGIFEPLTARVIHSLPKLKLIACKSMGYNYVDLEAAKECGVSVTHLKSAFSIDVADYVTACILAHNKRLFAYYLVDGSVQMTVDVSESVFLTVRTDFLLVFFIDIDGDTGRNQNIVYSGDIF